MGKPIEQQLTVWLLAVTGFGLMREVGFITTFDCTQNWAICNPPPMNKNGSNTTYFGV